MQEIEDLELLSVFVVTFFTPYHSVVHPSDKVETSRLLQPAVEGSSHVVQSVRVSGPATRVQMLTAVNTAALAQGWLFFLEMKCDIY